MFRSRLEHFLGIFYPPFWGWLTKKSPRNPSEDFLTPPFGPWPKRLPKSLILTPKSYQNDGFWLNFDPYLDPILAHFRARFWAKNGAPSGPRFERKHKELQWFLNIWGAQKGSILEPFSGSFWAPFWLPFWIPCFGVGRPAEIRILPSLNPGPGPEVRRFSRPGH